ncbi:MAG: hypothetical protein CR971_01550 [candidate division SR1 bacterium]|nr:MAG: hypothetical protein CR971_01550 [candidate division SR1 bacterium]
MREDSDLNVQESTSQYVKPIEKSHEIISTREQIRELVEFPLVSACEILYDKKITTFMSSANGTNIYLSLYYDALTPDNKVLINRLGGVIHTSGHSGYRPIVTFSLPPIEAPISYIISWSEWIANTLKKQNIILKKPTYSVEDFRRIVANEDTNVNIIDKYFNDNSFKYMGLRNMYSYDKDKKRFIFNREI